MTKGEAFIDRVKALARFFLKIGKTITKERFPMITNIQYKIMTG